MNYNQQVSKINLNFDYLIPTHETQLLLFFENSQTSSPVGYGKRRRIDQQWFSLTREHTPMLVRGQGEGEDEK